MKSSTSTSQFAEHMRANRMNTKQCNIIFIEQPIRLKKKPRTASRLATVRVGILRLHKFLKTTQEEGDSISYYACGNFGEGHIKV